MARDADIAWKHVGQAVRLIQQGLGQDLCDPVVRAGGPSQSVTSPLADVLEPELDLAALDLAASLLLRLGELEVPVIDPGQQLFAVSTVNAVWVIGVRLLDVGCPGRSSESTSRTAQGTMDGLAFAGSVTHAQTSRVSQRMPPPSSPLARSTGTRSLCSAEAKRMRSWVHTR